ncbi:MAG: Gfo/Idh/MocA family oxidoreductase [Bryobacterales bacterium]|nr:Gfo/Idh/MocA family oxidoreductase [Bryobacterales bacterium]
MQRRAFLGAGLAAAQTSGGKSVRLGFIGAGSRGTSLLRTALRVPGVEVPAVCDLDEARSAKASALVAEAGAAKAATYTDYRRLLERTDIDAVVNATTWSAHVPISVAAMEHGKTVGSEVPAAMTVEDCWRLVDTAEKTRRGLMLLENVCYFRNVLMLLNAVQAGRLGELVHCEAGYQHDTRFLHFTPDGRLTWRGVEASQFNGNLYPTHPIGPVAWWLDINRGNRFTYLTSMSSQAAGVKRYAEKRFGKDHPAARRPAAMGDVSTTLIATESGATVTLYYSVQTPRPYDLIFRVQGAEGIYSGTLDKIFVEPAAIGERPASEAWQDLAPFYAQYEHRLWKEHGEEANRHGHGGADDLCLHQFIAAVRRGGAMPIDVYDSVTWSALVALTAQSVAQRSKPVDFPDFTRGKWKQPRALEFL